MNFFNIQYNNNDIYLNNFEYVPTYFTKSIEELYYEYSKIQKFSFLHKNLEILNNNFNKVKNLSKLNILNFSSYYIEDLQLTKNNFSNFYFNKENIVKTFNEKLNIPNFSSYYVPDLQFTKNNFSNLYFNKENIVKTFDKKIEYSNNLYNILYNFTVSR